ncbi:dimethylmenaquinone methyltransferase [Alkalihalophilus pseudofirmus]|nr:dimethylmenaquinone methyltransferase [Alkalihalophilus pseudofirmus]
MERNEIERLRKLATTNVSDALDKLCIKGGVFGISPVWDCEKIVGRAVTVKITAAGLTTSKHHLGTEAINIAGPEDIIVVDNGGRQDVSCWGGVLATAAHVKNISGVVIDGACRDVDEFLGIGFPVYARNAVPLTARNRVMQESFNELIQFGGVQVRPKDYVIADRSGVCIIPQEKIIEVLDIAEEFYNKEEMMISAIKKGENILEVDTIFNYEKMLNKEK